MPTRRVRAGDVELAIAEEGVGGRPLLLLHGFSAAKEDFSTPLEAHGDGGSALDRLAAAGWHAVAPDQRGHGASDHPEGEGSYTMRSFADDALALADALGWERFAVFGHSMGGVVAQTAALAAPGRVTALVLMDTWHGPLTGVERSELDTAIEIVRTEGMGRLCDLMLELRGEGPLDTPASRRVEAERPGWAEFTDRKRRACSAAMYAAMLLEMVDQPERLGALAALTAAPVLVIVGEEDQPFLGACEQMAAGVPGARLEVIPDAGHSPQFENPAAWWKALDDFLSEVTA